ncbi:MAG: hypothetical protein E6Q96_07480 [Cyclobacteriaceae bacterium]|nr:MAG: hypothetical protein E6Q96_07480 [Cyclobacteriaceae bacterium]
MRLMIRSFAVVLLILIQINAFSQEVKVTSGFIKDSVAIGEPVSYYLTARYPERVMALFPDSTFKFAPFEFNRKDFFATKTVNGISYDSAVYTLSTFEIDPTQYLSLPVYVTTARDCTAFESTRDSIFLIEQIKVPAGDTLALKNLELKSNTLYERVRMQFNTFILMIVLGVILVVAIIVWIIFGKKIIRHFRIKRLEKQFKKFIAAFSEQIEDATKTFSREKTERALSTWKKYQEQLERKPYTKLTTREIVRMDQDKALEESLSAIDKSIYGNQPVAAEPLQTLKVIAEQRFMKKIEQLRHG